MKRYLLAALVLVTLVAVLQYSQPEAPAPVVYWKVVGVPARTPAGERGIKWISLNFSIL